MIDFYKMIIDDDIYGNPDLAPQVYYGYSWRIPYSDMIYRLTGSLDPVQAKGVAVGTSVKHLGMPRLFTDPPTNPNFIAYLQSKIVMEAIAANDWCLVKALVDADDSAYFGKWWGNIQIDQEQNRKFLGGSELLPVHTDYVTGEGVFTFADDADLAFEYSSVKATIKGHITSIKNPKTGFIKADSCGEVIIDENIKAPGDCDIKIG